MDWSGWDEESMAAVTRIPQKLMVAWTLSYQGGEADPGADRWLWGFRMTPRCAGWQLPTQDGLVEEDRS